MKLKDDLNFAKLVSEGEPSACKKFVEEFSDVVLYRIRQLMKNHCTHMSRDCVCAILFLLNSQKDGLLRYRRDLEICDECMDSYVWFFEFLKNKVKSYEGKNDCSLKTFVWSVINSHTTYIEWLRWKYGRAF